MKIKQEFRKKNIFAENKVVWKIHGKDIQRKTTANRKVLFTQKIKVLI
jgi:hypothetical protein